MMESNRIRGRTVLVTGATSGIGEACARAFASRGAHPVLLARRADRLAALAGELESDHGVPVRTVVLDVRDRAGVLDLARTLHEDGIVPDVLINNAGLARGLGSVQEGSFEDWDEMIDTNVKGLLNVTRAFLPRMIERGRGHVINIGSIAGRQVYPNGNVYNATKFAVRALNEAMYIDTLGTPIRVSSIDPGLVETEFSLVRFRGDRDRADAVYRGTRPLSAEDVADAVLYVANAPEHVNVLEMVILPTAQRSATLVDRD